MDINLKEELKENIKQFAVEGLQDAPIVKAINTIKTGHPIRSLKENYLVPHKVRKIGDGIYAITEAITATCYLIVGEKEALLIDTGLGIKGLRETVEEITDLPLSVYVTHGSPWTVGGAAEFPKVHVAKKDIPEAKLFSKFKWRRKIFDFDPGKYLAGLKDHDLCDGECNFEAVTDEDKLDLGGRKVTIKPCLATTDGCIVFKDSKTSYTFCGNAAGPIIFLVPKKSATLYDYSRTLDTIIKFSQGSRNYSHYMPFALSSAKTLEMSQLVKAAVKKGNRRDKLLETLVSPDNRRILIYFPSRTKGKALRDKWQYFWDGQDRDGYELDKDKKSDSSEESENSFLAKVKEKLGR